MSNWYIPPNDSEMLYKLDLEIEKQKDIPLLLLCIQSVIKFVRHVIKLDKNGKILEDILSQNNA